MKTAWKPLKSNYEQIRFDDVQFVTENEISKLLQVRFNLSNFANMVASSSGILPTDKEIECIMIRDEVAKHPKLSKHEKVKNLITIHYREFGKETFLPLYNVFAIEIQNDPTHEDVANIIETYFATPNIFVAFYDPKKPSNWLLTVTDPKGNHVVKYAADLSPKVV